MRIEKLLATRIERSKLFRPEHGAYFAFPAEDGSYEVTHQKEKTVYLKNEEELNKFAEEKGINGDHIGLIIVGPCEGPPPIEK